MNIPLVLDGAMGTELMRYGLDLSLPLWSADINLTHPESVQEVHDNYIAAGSDVTTKKRLGLWDPLMLLLQTRCC